MSGAAGALVELLEFHGLQPQLDGNSGGLWVAKCPVCWHVAAYSDEQDTSRTFWVRAGDQVELGCYRETCRGHADDAALWAALTDVDGYPEWRAEHMTTPKGAARVARPRWESLDNIEAQPIVFVEKPFFQKAAFHLVTGIKNAGKGTFLALTSARITRGELGERRQVMWAALGEDSYAIDVKPRVLAAGGDVARVHVLQGTLTLPGDVDELRRKALELGDVAAIILDPLGGGLASGLNTNRDDIRPALAALNELADATGAMVLGVRHISIKPDRMKGGALAGVLGSSDWVNIPRAVLALVHDDVDVDVRHLFVVAGNRVAGGTGGLMFRIEARDVVPGGEPVTCATIIGESAKDPDELLSNGRPRKASRTDTARRLILELLAGAPVGRIESDELDAAVAKQTGLTAKTVQNTRTELHKAGLVKPWPEKDATGAVVRWFVTVTNAGRAELESDPDSVGNEAVLARARARGQTHTRDVDCLSRDLGKSDIPDPEFPTPPRAREREDAIEGHPQFNTLPPGEVAALKMIMETFNATVEPMPAPLGEPGANGGDRTDFDGWRDDVAWGGAS